jgi:hypothetical protein
MPRRSSNAPSLKATSWPSAKQSGSRGSNKIRLVGRLRSEMRPLMTGIQHHQAFVLAMDRQTALALYTDLGAALGLR